VLSGATRRRTNVASYRKIYYDGGNGMCLGEVVEVELDEDGVARLESEDEDSEDGETCAEEFSSRNNDGLLENETGDTYLVPLD